MKIYNKIVYDFDNNIIEEDYYEYNGPLTLAGPSGASTGSGGTGGGTVGPAGVKVDKKGNKKYGTALDAKLTSNRFENNNDNNNGGGVPDALVKIAKLDPAVAKMATGPTTAEVSQSEAANADADTEANRLFIR